MTTSVLHPSPGLFRQFLLDTILTEVDCCVTHQHGTRTVITALGKLMHEHFLVQTDRAEPRLEDLQIVHLPLELVDRLLDALHPHW
jgi:hypothetical protein